MLAELPERVIVPGHGAVVDRDFALAQQAELVTVAELATRAHVEGLRDLITRFPYPEDVDQAGHRTGLPAARQPCRPDGGGAALDSGACSAYSAYCNIEGGIMARRHDLVGLTVLAMLSVRASHPYELHRFIVDTHKDYVTGLPAASTTRSRGWRGTS